MDDEDDSLTKQLLSLAFENNAFVPYIGSWLIFNALCLVLLIYIAIRISLKK
jgi:hypothetical protein